MVFAKAGAAGHVYAASVAVTFTLSHGDFKTSALAQTDALQIRKLAPTNHRKAFNLELIMSSCIASATPPKPAAPFSVQTAER